MGIVWNETNIKSNGGTELMARQLESRLDNDLLDNFQIFLSRVTEEPDPSKIRILWSHDLPDDPAAVDALRNNKWRRFHRFVFVSNWQMQQFIGKFGLPWEKCIVMKNAIEPIEDHIKTDAGTVRLAYFSNPIKGLQILIPVFNKLCEEHDNIELFVASSFQLYGWGDRDKQLMELYNSCTENPKINYNAFVDHSELMEILKKCHIFVLPSIFPETSCIALLEAMSAKLHCVHSNLGALYETASNFTTMYQFNENMSVHAGLLYSLLNMMLTEKSYLIDNENQKRYIDSVYNWDRRMLEWQSYLIPLLDEKREMQSVPSEEMFSYKI